MANENWRAYEDDPKFKALDYDKQIRIKQLFAQKYLTQDPVFQKLPPAAQRELFTRYVTKPVLATNINTPEGAHLHNLMASAGTVENYPGFLNKMKAWLLDAGLKFRASAIAGGIGQLNKFMDESGANDVLQNFTKAMESKAINTYFPTPVEDYESSVKFYNLNREDLRKIRDYNTSVSRRVRGLSIANTIRDFGVTLKIAGVLNKIFVGSGASVYRATMFGDKYVKGGLLTNKLFQRIAQAYQLDKNHGKIIQFLGAKLLPTVIEEGAEGLVWATKGLIEDLVEGKDLTAENALKDFAQDFGFGMGMQAVLSAGSKLRHVLHGSNRKILGITDDVTLGKNLTATEGEYLLIEGISPDSIPPAVKKDLIARGHGDLIKAMQDHAQRAKIDHTIDATDPEQVLTQVMKTAGLDVKHIGPSFHIESFGPMPFKKVVNNFQDVLIEYERFMNRITGKVSAEDFIARGVATDSLKARRALEVTLPNDTKVSGKAFINNLNPETGKIINEDVLTSVHKFLKQNDVPQEIIDKLSVKQYDDYFAKNRFNMPIGNELPLPKYLHTMADQEHYLSGLKRYLDRSLKLGNVDLPPKTLEKLFQTLKLPRGSRLLTDDTWIARQVANLQGNLKQLPNGSFEIRYADGTLENFATKSQLGESLYNNTIDTSDVKNFLENEIGYALKQNDEGRWLVQAEGRNIGPYDDINTLLRENPSFRPPYPLESGPRISLINEDLNKIRIINDKIITGPVDLIERHLKNHSDDWKHARKKLTKIQLADLGNKQIKIDKQRRIYWLEDPVTGFKKQFRSLYGKGGMETFLSNTKTKFQDLQQQAAYGGYKISADKGGFYMVGKDKSFFARTLEQLEDLISKEAKQLNAPEMTAQVFPEDTMLQLRRTFAEKLDLPAEGHKTLDEAVIDQRNQIGFGEVIKDQLAFFRGSFGILEGAIKKFPAAKIFLKPAQALKISLFNHTRHTNNILLQLTSRRKLAKINRAKAIIMGEILMQERPRTEWLDAAKEADLPINDNMISEMHFIRDSFDQLQDTFDIPKSMRIEYYYSRFKRVFEKEIKRGGIINDAARIIREAVNDRILPAGAEEYFQHARTSDVLSFALEKDPYSILMKYIDIGFKRKNVMPFWEKLNNTLINYRKTEGAAGIVPERVLKTTQHILDEARGQHNSEFLKSIKKATLTGTVQLAEHLQKVEDKILKMFPKRQFDEKVSLRTKLRDRLTGFSQSVITDDPFAPVGRAIIGATQAFKPWLVVRNLHQPLITVAPFFGFDYTLTGYRTVINPKNFNPIFEYMRDNGFLNTVAPREIPIVRGKNSILQNINDKGLWAYGWSDTINRMVTFATVDHKFTDIVEAMRKNPSLTKSWFVKHSGLFSVDPVTQDAVFSMLTKGDIVGARDIFARQVISNGQFDYMGIANPRMFTGMKGKIFGTFGTYPVQYAENILRALRSGDIEDKTLFVARLLGVSAALTAFYTDMFGADVQSFNPLSTMFFTGSPIYQQAVDTLEISGGLGTLAQTGELSYRAKQALARTKLRVPQTFIPYLARSMDIITAGVDPKHGDGWFPPELKKVFGTPGRN